MRESLQRIRGFSLCAAAFLVLQSCTAPVMLVTAGTSMLQAGSSAFINGELESALVKPMREVYDAADAALRELQFTMGAGKLGEVNGYLFAYETQHRRIEINVSKRSPAVTKVNIRVGVFGDQSISRLIMETMQTKLNPRPQVQPSAATDPNRGVHAPGPAEPPASAAGPSPDEPR